MNVQEMKELLFNKYENFIEKKVCDLEENDIFFLADYKIFCKVSKVRPKMIIFKPIIFNKNIQYLYNEEMPSYCFTCYYMEPLSTDFTYDKDRRMKRTNNKEFRILYKPAIYVYEAIYDN